MHTPINSHLGTHTTLANLRPSDFAPEVHFLESEPEPLREGGHGVEDVPFAMDVAGGVVRLGPAESVAHKEGGCAGWRGGKGYGEGRGRCRWRVAEREAEGEGRFGVWVRGGESVN